MSYTSWFSSFPSPLINALLLPSFLGIEANPAPTPRKVELSLFLFLSLFALGRIPSSPQNNHCLLFPFSVGAPASTGCIEVFPPCVYAQLHRLIVVGQFLHRCRAPPSSPPYARGWCAAALMGNEHTAATPAGHMERRRRMKKMALPRSLSCPLSFISVIYFPTFLSPSCYRTTRPTLEEQFQSSLSPWILVLST